MLSENEKREYVEQAHIRFQTGQSEVVTKSIGNSSKKNPNYIGQWRENHQNCQREWRKRHPSYGREWRKQHPNYIKERRVQREENEP